MGPEEAPPRATLCTVYVYLGCDELPHGERCDTQRVVLGTAGAGGLVGALVVAFVAFEHNYVIERLDLQDEAPDHMTSSDHTGVSVLCITLVAAMLALPPRTTYAAQL